MASAVEVGVEQKTATDMVGSSQPSADPGAPRLAGFRPKDGRWWPFDGLFKSRSFLL